MALFFFWQWLCFNCRQLCIGVHAVSTSAALQWAALTGKKEMKGKKGRHLWIGVICNSLGVGLTTFLWISSRKLALVWPLVKNTLCPRLKRRNGSLTIFNQLPFSCSQINLRKEPTVRWEFLSLLSWVVSLRANLSTINETPKKCSRL